MQSQESLQQYRSSANAKYNLWKLYLLFWLQKLFFLKMVLFYSEVYVDYVQFLL